MVCLHCPIDDEAMQCMTMHEEFNRELKGNTNSSAWRIWRRWGSRGQVGWWR